MDFQGSFSAHNLKASIVKSKKKGAACQNPEHWQKTRFRGEGVISLPLIQWHVVVANWTVNVKGVHCGGIVGMWWDGILGVTRLPSIQRDL